MVGEEPSSYFAVAKFCFIPDLAANEVICILENNFYVNWCLLWRSSKDLTGYCVSWTNFSHHKIEVADNTYCSVKVRELNPRIVEEKGLVF